MLYQPAKAFLTASYRQFIVKAAGIQNATASCFLCGSTQKKTAGQGQHRQAFLRQQTDESPYMRPKKQKNSLSQMRFHPRVELLTILNSQIHESSHLF